MGSSRASLTAARARIGPGVIAVLIACGVGALAGGIPEISPVGAALAQDPKGAGNTVRPEIGKPIQAALDLLKSKKGKASRLLHGPSVPGQRRRWINFVIDAAIKTKIAHSMTM